jgi:DNA-binding NarL/FixJ family response regulator
MVPDGFPETLRAPTIATMGSAPNVLLVDDHAMFREGLARLLAEIAPRSTIHHACTCNEALARLQGVVSTAPIDLVLLDLGLPGQSGLNGLITLREAWPAVPVVVLSGTDDSPTVLGSIDAGAMGFVSKSSPPEVLAQALQTVLAGGVYVPPATSAFASPQDSAASTARHAQPSLTPRQWDVLRLLLQGQPNKRIERALDLAPSTVKAHVSSVLRALGVTTRTQAVIAASRLNLHWRAAAPAAPGPSALR